jgi:hypothetical protein
MMVDFDQFIEPLHSLPRKAPEYAKNGNLIVGAIDKQVLIQALEQESSLNSEEEFERAISIAHTENVSTWVDAIAHCTTTHPSPMRLQDIQKTLRLPIVEIWLGLLLGDFKLEQRGNFYDSNELWIS